MQHARYFPVLRRRRKEWEALRYLDLDGDVASVTCPIIAFDPDSVVDRQRGQQQQVRVETWRDLASSFPVALWMSPDDWFAALPRVLAGRSDLQVVGAVAAADLRVCRAVLSQVHDRFGRGALVTVEYEDLENESVRREIDKLSRAVPLAIVLKLNYWTRGQSELATLIEQGVAHLRSHDATRLAVAAGSYPLSNGGMPENNLTTVKRVEWSVYKQLGRRLDYQFSDYGPVCSDKGDGRGDSKKVTPAIRYTTGAEHCVLRGRQGGWGEFQSAMRQLIRELVNSDFFYGPEYSWGDLRLSALARSANSEDVQKLHAAVRHYEWSHHLAVVARGVGALDASRAPSVAPQVIGGA